MVQKRARTDRAKSGKIAAASRRKKGPMSAAFPLALTANERRSLIVLTRIKRKLKQRLEAAPPGSQILEVTRREIDDLEEEISRAAMFAPQPDKRQLVAVLHKLADLGDAITESLAAAESQNVRKSAPSSGNWVYQFKITLRYIEPAVWRRIQVPDETLAELHCDIQKAFGWYNCHLHQFEIDGEQYGEPMPDPMGFELDLIDEATVSLSDLIPQKGRRKRWIYQYDFGDSWLHELKFEGFVACERGTRYPVCVDGARACPPEDCGGPWGYLAMLDVLANPQHEQHEQLLEWHGPLDPEAFDARETTKALQRLK